MHKAPRKPRWRRGFRGQWLLQPPRVVPVIFDLFPSELCHEIAQSRDNRSFDQ